MSSEFLRKSQEIQRQKSDGVASGKLVELEYVQLFIAMIQSLKYPVFVCFFHSISVNMFLITLPLLMPIREPYLIHS